MRTRVNRLRHEGVAVAKFYVDKDESFILGKKPHWEEKYTDDFIPVVESRFLVKGSTLSQNTFNEYQLTAHDDIAQKGNPYWTKVTALEETIGICLNTTNPNHRVIKPHRLVLGPNETMSVGFPGYLAPVLGEVSLNDTPVNDMQIVRLSGSEITVTAGPNGGVMAALEIDFLNA